MKRLANIDKALFLRVLRFGVVGFSGFVIDFSITWLLYELFECHIALATGFGFCFGATSNYILNRRWTWRSDNPNIAGEFTKFFGVSLLGLGIHYIVLFACISMPYLVISIPEVVDINNDFTSKLIATAVVMIWNFLANNFYTFRSASNSSK